MNSTGPLYLNSSVRRRNLRTGNVDTNSLVFNESLNRVGPGTNKGRLWVRSGTPNTLMFTNENDVDSNISSFTLKSGGSSVTNSNILDFVGSSITATDGGGGVATITYNPTLVVKEDGVSLGNFSSLNFIGKGVTSTDGGGGTANITYSDSIGVEEEGVSVGTFDTLNFVGGSVTATDGGSGVSDITLSIPDPSLEQVLTSGDDANSNNITGLEQIRFTSVLRVGSTVAGSGNSMVSIGLNNNATGSVNVSIGADSNATFGGSVLVGASGEGSSNSFLHQIGYGGTKNGIGYNVGIGNTSYNGSIGYNSGGQESSKNVIGSNTVNGPNGVYLGPSLRAQYNNKHTVIGSDISFITRNRITFLTSSADVRNLDDETILRGVRTVYRTVNTTNTTATNALTYSPNDGEFLSVDCFVTEINTEGVIGTLNHNLVYTFRDYFLTRKGSTATVTAGTTNVSNPDGAPVSTLTLAAINENIRLTITPIDDDNRTWRIIIVFRGTDLM